MLWLCTGLGGPGFGCTSPQRSKSSTNKRNLQICALFVGLRELRVKALVVSQLEGRGVGALSCCLTKYANIDSVRASFPPKMINKHEWIFLQLII